MKQKKKERKEKRKEKKRKEKKRKEKKGKEKKGKEKKGKERKEKRKEKGLIFISVVKVLSDLHDQKQLMKSGEVIDRSPSWFLEGPLKGIKGIPGWLRG